MCSPGSKKTKPPLSKGPVTPPTALKACPNNVNVIIRASDGVSAPCTVIPLGGSIELKGVPSAGSGTFQWTTTSPRIVLTQANSQTVKITAQNQVSAGRGAEIVQLVYTPSGCPALAPVTVGVTVISVTFSKSTTQTYGYDDMNLAAGVTHHVSVKRLAATTVHVAVAGGGTGDDLSFTSDDASIADAGGLPRGTGAAFELTINGKDVPKAQTAIRAHCKCSPGPVCASIFVNVYTEKRVSAKVAKVFDSHSAGTTLARPNFDVGVAATLINTSYKTAVVNLALTDKSATGGAIDVRFDLDGNGKLTLEAGGIGPEIAAINAAFTDAGQKVVIVKGLVYIFYLSTAAVVGATTLTFKSSYAGNLDFIELNHSYPLGPGTGTENVQFTARAANVFTLATALTLAHPVADGILFPAGGLGGNPIILDESASTTEDLERWVIGHECGHATLGFADLDAQDDLMNFMMNWTDHKLRFMDMPRHYHPPGGTESQWQLITR